ncbi:ribonucleoside-diphosphate reductase subunit beta [Coprobacillus sp. CAG:183]|nr:ribonucleoside-diphosphate reductase subunit beta [Coprobacillus sp. CAG:183]
MIIELQKEEPTLFTPEKIEVYRNMLKRGVEEEIAWGQYVLGNRIEGLTMDMVSDYIHYLGNLRAFSLNFEPLYEGFETEPEAMKWVSIYSNANNIKTDFFEAKSTAYAKSSAIEDDL